jgi:hypothetical protein
MSYGSFQPASTFNDTPHPRATICLHLNIARQNSIDAMGNIVKIDDHDHSMGSYLSRLSAQDLPRRSRALPLWPYIVSSTALVTLR